MKCERCGKVSSGKGGGLHDYCAVCSKNLCPECMEKGCCGHKPALSGQQSDYSDTGNGGDDEPPTAA